MPARDLRISAVLDTFVLPLDERGDWECILASAGVRGWGARRGSWTARRRLIVFAAALVGILVSTLTVAASEGWWFFRSGEAPKPISDVYVVKNGTWSGVAWTLTAYLSGTDGVCFAIGPTSSSSTNGTGAAMSCDQIAGVPGHEKISDVLVEDHFRRCARIRATENDGERMLRLSRLRAASGGGFALRNFAADKTRISFLELGERRIRAHRSDWMICGKNKRDNAKQTNERDEYKFWCGLHFDCDYGAARPSNASKI